MKQLEEDGVPAANVVFLKDKAETLEAVRRELRALAARAGAGSTLIFYFQGHGLQKDHKTYLACYDVDTNAVERTAFAVDELAALLGAEFKGERLLLLGDCCHSGALASVVKRYEGRPVRAACLTSSTASNRSTEHWTFTEALIAGFAGDGLLDRNHDGVVTFGELDGYVHDEMKFREGQLTHAVRTTSFEEGFVISSVPKGRALPGVQGPHSVGEYVEACDREGKWYASRVLAAREGKWLVHFLGWDSRWDEWVGAEKLRPSTRGTLELGARYEVEWQKGKWYLGVVMKSEEEFFYFVHYEGELGEDDEWITPDHARRPRHGGKPEFEPLAPRPAARGDAVCARWRSAWYLAEMNDVEARLFHVRYADGDEGSVLADELIPIARAGEVAIGDRVLACWNAGPRMLPGTVTAHDGKTCTVKWDDGSPETRVPVAHVARVRAVGPR